MWKANLKTLLGGDDVELERLATRRGTRWLVGCATVTAVTCAVYGFTFGLWRSGTQGICTAIKFPLVVFLTCAGNALLNGLLGLLLGSGLSMRQSGIAILMSFTVAGIVLSGFAPIMLFLLWNTPAIDGPSAVIGQSVTLLTHVTVIAVAGYVGNLRLWQLLKRSAGAPGRAALVLLSWLGGNLLLGSQVSWILRPWIGQPDVPTTFFSPYPLEGNFFEAVWGAVSRLVSNL